MVQRIVRKILDTPVEPPSTDWLWLHQSGNSVSLKYYTNGKWTPLTSSSSLQSLPVTGNYVTSTALQVRLQNYVTTTAFNNRLSEYAKVSDIPDITNITSNVLKLDDKISQLRTTFESHVAEFQQHLDGLQINYEAGNGITISDNTISVDCATTVASGNTKPVTSGAVYTANNTLSGAISDVASDVTGLSGTVTRQGEEITSMLSALTRKQDKLTAGNGIQIVNNVISATGSVSPSPAVVDDQYHDAYLVDLETFGITEGYLEKDGNGEYSDEQYETMFNNAIGFTRAFEYARDNGYTEIHIPKGDYCFTPIYNWDPDLPDNEQAAAVGVNNAPTALVWLMNTENMTIDFMGSTWHVCVESTRKSKYYNASGMLMSGGWYHYHYKLLCIAQCNHIHIKNGNFRGDCHTRSYTIDKERNAEAGYGISSQGVYTYSIRISNCDGSGFSGDFISGARRILRIYYQPFWSKFVSGVNCSSAKQCSINAIKNYGYYYSSETSGVAKNDYSSNKYYAISGMHSLGKWHTGVSYPDYIRKEASKRIYCIDNNLGYTRMLNAYCPNISVLTYKQENGEFVGPLRVIPCGYLENFHLYDNETHIRLQFSKELGLGIGKFRGISDDSAAATYFDDLTIDDNYTIPASEDIDDTADTVDDDDNPSDVTETISQNDHKGKGVLVNIVSQSNYDMHVEHCNIHNNGRGGMCPPFNDTLIENCVFDKVEQKGTELAVGTHLKFTNSNTNYHLNVEDVVIDHLTVRNCKFYGSQLMFPSVLKFDFLNNICYGGTPSVGNSYFINTVGNQFSKAGGLGGDGSRNVSWGNGSASKACMTRTVNISDNIYTRMSGFRNPNTHNHTIVRVNNCTFMVTSMSTNGGFSATKRNVKGSITPTYYTNCVFNIKVNGQNANNLCYLDNLNHCTINGGYFATRSARNCIINDSVMYYYGNADNTVNDIVHINVENTKGIKLNGGFILPSLHTVAQNEPKRSYIVHFKNCEVDMTDVHSSITYYNSISYRFRFDDNAKWYKEVLLHFDGCRLVGSPGTSSLAGVSNITNVKYYHDTTIDKYGYSLSNSSHAGCQYVAGGDSGFNPSWIFNGYYDGASCVDGDVTYTINYYNSSTKQEEEHTIVEGTITVPNPFRGGFLFENCHFDFDSNTVRLFNAFKMNQSFLAHNCTSTVPFELDSNNYKYWVVGESLDTNVGGSDRPMFTKYGSHYFDTVLGKPLFRTTINTYIYDLKESSVLTIHWSDAGGTTY